MRFGICTGPSTRQPASLAFAAVSSIRLFFRNLDADVGEGPERRMFRRGERVVSLEELPEHQDKGVIHLGFVAEPDAVAVLVRFPGEHPQDE